ncbi:V-type ATP synthase subunit E family protein [Sedimentibacter sp. MB31-C6]|uniref:V-type ATP synthase subunit E family protein n=1 Tax=Sedimentibacter sp. MB31-C6 TaxID=3109366 RepID=UPI002DDD34F1|nr:V-type ATP synthase subunit E family protein [Sedimentibacter sp. MB36-C1]WSI04122.1 V-type ATP synthase subunit E family protein [Sedimentibacter sp. MB36-C1]
MVTIEQKLLLFSKLLNQSMDKKFNEDFKEIEKQNELRIQKNKEEVDREAKEIEEKAKKKAETKRIESLSKSKVIIKREIIVLKENYYNIFMENFKNKLQEFIKSKIYKTFLEKEILEFQKYIKSSEDCNLIIYLTKKDNDNYSSFLKEEFKKYPKIENISFIIREDILGGLIIEIVDKNVKVDLSIDAILEENKSYIMQTIFEALEAGDYND